MKRKFFGGLVLLTLFSLFFLSLRTSSNVTKDRDYSGISRNIEYFEPEIRNIATKM